MEKSNGYSNLVLDFFKCTEGTPESKGIKCKSDKEI